MCTCVGGACTYVDNVAVEAQLSGFVLSFHIAGSLSFLLQHGSLQDSWLADLQLLLSLVSFSHLMVGVLALKMYAIASGFLYGSRN